MLCLLLLVEVDEDDDEDTKKLLFVLFVLDFKVLVFIKFDKLFAVVELFIFRFMF